MTDTEILKLVREYINSHEHTDDWNVPCVYTKRLRVLLNMPKSPL